MCVCDRPGVSVVVFSVLCLVFVFMYGIQGVCVCECVDALSYLTFVLLCQHSNRQVFN